MAYELKEYLNSINFTKQDVMNTEDLTWEKKYPAFIVNKCLSYHYDTLIAANEMNGYHFLPNNMQYHFLLNIVRKKKRFAKWMKAEKLKDLDLAMDIKIANLFDKAYEIIGNTPMPGRAYYFSLTFKFKNDLT